MHLLDFPDEILDAIPQHIRNIEDFNNARSSCRRLRSIFSATSPQTILRLAASSAPIFVTPHPHFLIMATASQVSDWALGNEERTQTLREHLQGGVHGLLDLCLQVGSLTLEDIRRLYLARFEYINHLADRIDKMAGPQWYQTPDFWDGGASEAYTLDTDPDRCAFQYLIYGELFKTSMQAYLQPKLRLPSFDLDVRLDYIKYCVPDWICKEGYPGLEVKASGPYAGSEPVMQADQIALQFVLYSNRWNRLWQPLVDSIGPEHQTEWKRALWWNCIVQTQGLWGARVLFLGPTPKQRAHLLDLWKQVDALTADDIPKTYYVGDSLRLPVSYAPDFAAEAHCCMRRYYPGT